MSLTMMQPDTPAWVADAVFYQIFPDRFASSERVPKPGNLEPWGSAPTSLGFKGGDLFGIVEHLDYLEALGINAIYLNPIFSSASNHRFHTFDYYQVDPLLGGNEALRELLDAAHARNIRIILDGVFNHASRGFWPFHHIIEVGSKSPYLDWFTVHGFPLHAYDGGRSPNYDAWWGLPALPKLNVANPETRDYLLNVAEYWIRFGADGWRLDVPTEIDDADFWKSFRTRVRRANPEAYLVGEIWHVAEEWLQGDRFDALMNYPLSFISLGLFAAKTLDTSHRPGGYEIKPLTVENALVELQRLHTAYHPLVVRSQLNLLDSHDMPRFLTLAGGERSALHLATVLQMTLPGAPCIYYGSEIGLQGGPDPDCRRAFPWHREGWDQETLDIIKHLIAIRKKEFILRHGDFQPLLAQGHILAFLRTTEEGCVLVVFNTGHGSVDLQLDIATRSRGERMPEDLWTQHNALKSAQWGSAQAGSARSTLTLALAARSARILKL